MSSAKNTHGAPLSREQIDAFGKELDTLRDRVLADLGERDARYIRSIMKLQRTAEVSGRGLLFVGFLPPAWGGGVAMLTLSKVLENMEIGHNVIHGQYDWMNDPELQGQSYEWDWACPADAWRHSHNFIHHTFTNMVGKDRDVGYGLLRMADEQPWHFYNAPQPLYAFLQMLLFEWAVAVHDWEFDEFLRGKKSLRALLADVRPTLRKAAPQVLKDFVVFPALAGPGAPFVFAGNLSANALRNIWAFLVIFCGHFPDGVQMYPDAEVGEESRGTWYLRQIRGSANIEGPRWLHILSGHLSRQIEHHLFPDLPAPRYDEIAPEVRAICAKYGVPYNTGSFPQQLGGALRRIVRCALPSRKKPAARPESQAPIAREEAAPIETPLRQVA